MKNGIVVFGATFVDIKGYPVTQYIPGGRNAGLVYHVHGGVSRNIAEDIANLELRPTFVTVLDNTGVSLDVVRKLENHKVNTDYIARTEDGLGTWLAIFDNDGDVIASISKRPDLTAIGDVLDTRGDELISNADAIVIEADMGPDLVKKVLELAQKYDKKVYAAISNMSIALERRDLLKHTACLVCNQQEAGMFFSEDFGCMETAAMAATLLDRIRSARIPKMVVTMGGEGAVYAQEDGDYGFCPAQQVNVIDTTGAGDAFFAGVAVGLTYGKTLAKACEIGTRLASSVIATKENVCPRFLPEEFGLPDKQTEA